ncbi:MAG TPA: VWA domain-containing protein [Candidatus Dormibacteraeota bacterium]|nr:VWA domain-containing protein [Candidatus Dormibacteraeota bacterium]
MTRNFQLLGIASCLAVLCSVGSPVRVQSQQQGGQQQAPPPPSLQPPATSPTTPPDQPPQNQQPGQRAPNPASTASQQGKSGDSDTRAYIRTRTDIVVVPVTVKNHDGQLVGDLRRDEFRVLQDGIEQKIIRFSSDPFPLSAVVVIDNNLSQKQSAQVQKSLIAIAAGFGPADEVAVVTYDQFPKTVSNFSFNNDQLFTTLKRLDLGSHFPGAGFDGGPLTAGPTANGHSLETGAPTPLGAKIPPQTTCLDDAVYAAAEMLKGRGRDRRKSVFLISDGNNSRQNEHNFNQTIQLLLTADVSVYSISVGHALLQHETARLEKYAQNTGGDAFFAGNAPDLERLYSKVTEQARNQYILAFTPEEADRTKDYHTIEVRVRRPDLDVSAREGYYSSAVNKPNQ